MLTSIVSQYSFTTPLCHSDDYLGIWQVSCWWLIIRASLLPFLSSFPPSFRPCCPATETMAVLRIALVDRPSGLLHYCGTFFPTPPTIKHRASANWQVAPPHTRTPVPLLVITRLHASCISILLLPVCARTLAWVDWLAATYIDVSIIILRAVLPAFSVFATSCPWCRARAQGAHCSQVPLSVGN